MSEQLVNGAAASDYQWPAGLSSMNVGKKDVTCPMCTGAQAEKVWPTEYSLHTHIRRFHLTSKRKRRAVAAKRLASMKKGRRRLVTPDPMEPLVSTLDGKPLFPLHQGRANVTCPWCDGEEGERVYKTEYALEMHRRQIHAGLTRARRVAAAKKGARVRYATVEPEAEVEVLPPEGLKRGRGRPRKQVEGGPTLADVIVYLESKRHFIDSLLAEFQEFQQGFRR